MVQTELRFTFPSSPKERADAEREGTRFGLMGRMSRAASGIVIAMFVGLAATGVWRNPSLAAVADVAVPLIVLAGFWRWGVPVLSRWFDAWRLRFEGGGGPALEIRSVTREGFFVSTTDGAHLFRWSAVTEIVETDEFILFYPGLLLPPHYIPKHAVPVSAEEPLRAMLAEVFESRREKLKLLEWVA
jgi:hypothetical protein